MEISSDVLNSAKSFSKSVSVAVSVGIDVAAAVVGSSIVFNVKRLPA